MTRVRISILAAFMAGATFAAGSASAETVTANLKTALTAPRKSIAGGAVSECQAEVCAARAASSGGGGLRGCRELARQVGALTSFGAGAKALTADELAACNEAARK